MVTVITKTIGPTGRDYTTFTLAEAATSTIGTSADLVANNEAIVFEADDTTFTTAASFYIANTSLTVDATRNISYTAASGRPVYEYTGAGTGVSFFDPYTRWSGIDVLAASAGKAMTVNANAGYGTAQAGTVIENATITASVTTVSCEKAWTGNALGTSSEPITLRNLVTKSKVAVGQFISGTGHTTGAHCLVVNCTHLGGSSPNQVWNWALVGGMPDASFKIINCANLAQDTSNDANITGGGVDVSGSTNNIGNAAAPTSGFRFENIGGGIGAQYTPTTSFSTPLGAGDYSVFMGSNGSLANVTGNDVWQQGVGPSANASVPTTDINGVARSGASCNPGAFEADGFVAPTITTQTIGPVGRDYATFTLAEASLPAEDITFTNRAFVFEADAGTYVEILNVDSTLVSDATRNATYRCADRSNRPVIGNGTQSTTVRMRDDFTRFDGIDSSDNGGGAFKLFDGQVGLVIENCVATSPGAAVYLSKSGANIGSAAAPCIVRNVVTKARFGVEAGAADLFVEVFNCTFLPGTVSPAGQVNYSFFATGSSACKLFNCIVLDSRADRQFQSTATITGGNNIGVPGGISGLLFSTNGVGSEATPTTSFSTPLGAGDFSVFMGATGALANKTGNDVWQQGVGPGSNSDVPTTDINGVARSGATANPGAFEADGFVAPTVITRTIDGSGAGDYTTFYLAEAAIDGLTGDGTGNLTANNESIVFEAVAGQYDHTAAFYVQFGPPNDNSDMTRNVTYKAQAGSEHGGQYGTGVRLITDSYSFAASILGNFCNFTNLVVEAKSSSTRPHGFVYNGGELGGSREPASGIVDRCLYEGSTSTNADRGLVLVTAFNGQDVGLPWAPVTLQNSAAKSGAALVYQYGGTFTGDTSYIKAINNTAQTRWGFMWEPRSSTDLTINIEATNNVFLGNPFGLSDQAPWYISSSAGPATNFTLNATGTNNFAYDFTGGNFPAALQGSPYPVTASTAYDPGAGDFALYVGKNGALLDSPNNDVIDGGVGPASNSDVPTTDILGDTRSGTTTNPGAFALAQATAVLTRTIGPVGRDYATFTAAEADVENIGGSADLVFENERIEFLADAATYSESVNFTSSMTTDATRQVTYKPAAGSEHGGVAGAGVRIQFGNLAVASVCVSVALPFTALDGLELDWTDTSGTGRACDINWTAKGAAFRDLILRHAGTGVLVQCANSRTTVSTDFPITFENSVLRGSGHGFRMWNYGASEKAFTVSNCTIECAFRAFDIYSNTDDTTYTVTNNLILAASEDFRDQGGGGTSTVLGSNNFGPQTSATHVFPAALKGSPYPITPTTNTTPGFGDYAIYEAATGALIVVADNAALGGGVGPAANADVPVLDINGVQRIGGGCDPGAFEGVRSRSTDVWDVMYGSHNIPGTFGNLVQSLPTTIADTVPSAAEIAAAVWAALTSANNVNGSFGRMTQQTHLSATKAGSLYQEEEE